MQAPADLTLTTSSNILDWRDGQPYSTQFDDVYFSTNPDNPQQGIAETDYVFLKHNDLAERWRQLRTNTFVIGETGFGTGLNFLCACKLWLETAPTNARLHFISTEKYPLTLAQMQQAHAIWGDLSVVSQALLAQYGALPDGVHRVILFSGRIQLTLHIGDIQTVLPQINTHMNAWFLDGFAPAKNPEMWQTDVFAHMARLSHTQTTFATFTSAGLVRRGLLAHGFAVKKVSGFGRKREMLFGQFAGQVQRNSLNVPSSVIANSTNASSAIVIGGGVAGCASAYALAIRGIKVTLLERHASIAQEASGNPRGVLYPRLAGQTNAADRLAISSYLFTLRLLAQLGLNAKALSQCGLLQLACNTRESQRIEAIANRELSDALARYVNVDEASQLAGIPLSFSGLFFPAGGWVNPQAFCYALVQHPNVTVLTDIQVGELKQIHPQWYAYAESKRVANADIVVIANANDAVKLTQSAHLPVTAVRGQMTTVSATAESAQLKTVLCTEGYITPAMDNSHCLGATFAKDDLALDVRELDNQKNIGMLQNISLNLAGLAQQVPNGRAALRCTSPDYLPLLGSLLNAEQLTQHPPKHKTDASALPWHHGLYVNIGHGSKGLTTAPLCAELLASMVLGDPLPVETMLAQQLDPNRFLLKALGLKRLVKLAV
jgi:tRNA 5-methylaminomethyl-2-thiouridine biosynthesis bifunctional protein